LSKVDVIVGGQYGSEAKGQMAGWLVEGPPAKTYNVVISNSGSQAGHTYVNDKGEKIVARHLPIAGILNKNATILLSPACIIDVEVLFEEMERFQVSDRVLIHPNAAIIDNDDKIDEEMLVRNIGSTGKGNGAALVDKIMRRGNAIAGMGELLRPFLITRDKYIDIINNASILIEGAQGFDLSVDGQFWPYCTSRNCWVGQVLADAWIHPHDLQRSYMVIRTFPIRVAGTSGGCHSDQREISWEELGVEPEITTVTKRVRRVFTFSMEQVIRAARINDPSYIAISHMDYLPVKTHEKFIHNLMATMHEELGYAPIIITGNGPKLSNWREI
jgi:adenylosuccinate synthase